MSSHATSGQDNPTLAATERADDAEYRPMARPEMAAYDIDADHVLYDPTKDTVHMLNPTAMVIWRLCDGNRTVPDLVEDLAILFEVPAKDVGQDVAGALEEFQSSHLLLARR